MNKKTKVLHLTFDMRIGGTEQVIKNLIEGSDKQLFDMSIFCLEQPIGPFGQMLQEQGISITSTQRRDGFDLKLIKAVRQHLKHEKIDVLHCHQYTPWVYGTLAALGTDTKVIFTEHGRFYPDRTNWKRKVVNPLLTLLTDKITAISEATKQALIKYEYIPQQKIEVIYNGIIPLQSDPEQIAKLRQQLKITANTQVIGTIARLDPIKNHSMMFRAFKQVLQNFPNTKLILVGDGEERENLEQLSEQLDISDNIIFTGYKPRPENYLKIMDIFLLSSLSEGTSMTLLEAMSLSKPCVVTDAGGNPEVIIHNENGMVTENDNDTLFANAICSLLSDNKLLETMSKTAWHKFALSFSVQTMCTKYKLIYINI